MIEVKIQLKIKDTIIELTKEELIGLHDIIHRLSDCNHYTIPFMPQQPNVVPYQEDVWWKNPPVATSSDSITITENNMKCVAT